MNHLESINCPSQLGQRNFNSSWITFYAKNKRMSSTSSIKQRKLKINWIYSCSRFHTPTSKPTLKSFIIPYLILKLDQLHVHLVACMDTLRLFCLSVLVQIAKIWLQGQEMALYDFGMFLLKLRWNKSKLLIGWW